MSFFLLSQICASITLFLDVLTFQFKRREVILAFMVASTLFLSFHYYFLDRMLASAILVASILRFIVSYYTTDKRWMWFFLVLAGIISIFTFTELIDIIPLVVSILFTLGAFQKDVKILRLFFLCAGGLLLIYDVLIFSPVGILLETVFVGSCLLGIWTFDKKKKSK